MKYTLDYDGDTFAQVEIKDTDIAWSAIKEMVEFWSNWEQMLKRYNGDYNLCWLKRLSVQMIRRGIPVNEEGWYSLDGKFDITVLNYYPYQFDLALLTVEPIV